MALSLSVSLRILCCILIAVFFIYSYIEKQNVLTEMRIQIPSLVKELKGIQEHNVRLRFAIDIFESPANLIHLSKQPEFSHLKFQNETEMLILPSDSG